MNSDLYSIVDPVTLKTLEIIDTSDDKCFDGTCGGCYHCLLRQAEYYNYIIIHLNPLCPDVNEDFIKEEEFKV